MTASITFIAAKAICRASSEYFSGTPLPEIIEFL
jgi:hypothetical protein